jgi:signal transduction histidine kinase
MADSSNQAMERPGGGWRRRGGKNGNGWGHRLRRNIVLLLGIAISLALAATSDRMLRHDAAIQASLTRQSLITGLQAHLEHELTLLRSLKSFFESSQFVTPEEFQRFVQQDPHIRDHNPWLRVGWAERLPLQESGTFTSAQDAVAEMMSGRFPFRYLEPQNAGDQLASFELVANPVSLAALRKATATNQATVSTPIHSDLLTRGSSAVLAFAPVFARDAEDHYPHLRGFVVGAYAINGMIRAYLDASLPEGGVAIRITDGDETIFSGEQIPAETEALPLRFGDHTWRIEIAPTVASVATWVPLLVLLFGLALTLLLYMHLLRIDGEYGRISAEVRAATSELAEANTALAERSAALEALAVDLRRTSTEAQLANSAKTMFLANMSHELRTPLNAMIGFSEIISTQLFGTDAGRYADYARDIHSSGKHLLGIIEDLLDMSRIELGKLELRPAPTRIIGIAEDVVRLLTHRADEHGVRIVCEGLEDLPAMRVDARALRQAFINLLSNAVKFSRVGGTVTIRGGRAGNGDVTVAVTDEGIGIEPGHVARIFDPFWQADAMRRAKPDGVGLGLAITRRLIEAHGGSVSAESERHVGTTMLVQLPAGRIVPANDGIIQAAG